MNGILPLFIDSTGFVYYLSDGLVPVAKSFDRSVEVILRELKPTAEDLEGVRRFAHVPGTRFVFDDTAVT
jgi:hypothetical protein